MPKSTAKKSRGHAEHMKTASSTGLVGRFQRPIKVTLLGAGSAFTPRLFNDVLRIPGQMGGIIALVDIDRSRLSTMKQLL
ncbi:MAG: alpha-glucosidase/alpha-galactosidase, partial [Chthoniobacterales bacterium]